MTEDEKYEIAVLASAVVQKRQAWEAQAMLNTPTDPIKREQALIALTIAQTEWWEAQTALSRAQARIASNARR